MSTDDHPRDQGEPAEPSPEPAPQPQGADSLAPGSSDASDAVQGEPQITLDRYLSRRRPPIRSSWMQIASLLAMLLALVMIFALKNRCGLAVSELVTGTAPPAQTEPN